MSDEQITRLTKYFDNQLDRIEETIVHNGRVAESGLTLVEDKVDDLAAAVDRIHAAFDGLARELRDIKIEVAAIELALKIQRHEQPLRQPEDRADAKSQPE